MWEELSELRQVFLGYPELNTEVYRNYIVQRFLYETLKLADHPMPEPDFSEIIAPVRQKGKKHTTFGKPGFLFPKQPENTQK